MSAASAGAPSKSLPCGLDECVFRSKVIRWPIRVLHRGVDRSSLPDDRLDELETSLREAETFFRRYCQGCDLAGDEEQRTVGLGWFLLAGEALQDTRKPAGRDRPERFRRARRLRKRIAKELEKDAAFDEELLKRAVQAQQGLTTEIEAATQPPVIVALEREEALLLGRLKEALREEDTLRALLALVPRGIGGQGGPSPGDELGFLEAWERRLRVVGDQLAPPGVPGLTWAREEQSALPAERSRVGEGPWNRSLRFVGEANGQARIVVEAILESDLGRRRRRDDDLALILDLIDQRRREAVTHGYHHVVGFVRHQAWPDQARRLAERYSADRTLEAGSTSLVFVDLDTDTIIVGDDAPPSDSLRFLFHPSPDQVFIQEIREAAEQPLQRDGYVEIATLGDETGISEPAVRWLVDRLPWDGERTHISGVGEVYRRSPLEG